MKKVILGIVIVAAVAAVGIFVYKSMTVTKQEIEDILPDNALLYVRMKNIEKNLGKFASTKLWQNISNIDLDALLAKGGLNNEQLNQYDNLKTYLSSPMVQTILKQFFGQEMAIAAYPDLFSFDLGPLNEVRSLENLSNIFVVTRLKPEVQFADFIAKIYALMDQSFTIETKDYKNHTISLARSQNSAFHSLAIAYVKIGDLVVFGLGERPVQQVIDVVSGDTHPISHDRNFRIAAAKFVEAPEIVAYGNLKQVVEEMFNMFMRLASLQSVQKENIETQLKDAFKGISGFLTFGFSFGSDASHQVSKHKYNVIYDINQMDSYMRKVYSCQPKENNSLRFIPEDVISYQWSNCFDFNNVWDGIKTELKKAPSNNEALSIEQTVAGIEGLLQLSLEKDILPAFDDELGGFLSDIDVQGAFPIPKILFFVKLKNRAVIEQLMKNLTDQPYLLMQTEDLGGIIVKYISLPIGVDLQPGYSFLGDYLLLSTNRQLIRDAVSVHNGQEPSLIENQNFKDIDFGLTGENNSIAFLRNDKLMSRLQSIADWAFNWMSFKVKQDQAFREGTVQRLNDLKTDVTRREAQLEQFKTQPDTAQKIEDAQNELAAAREKVKELEKTVEGFKEPTADPETVRLYLDNVIYPIFKGLESYSTIGSKVKWGGSLLESTVYLKIEN